MATTEQAQGCGMASCRGDRVTLGSQSSPTALDLGSVFEEELQQKILNSSCALGAVLGAPTMQHLVIQVIMRPVSTLIHSLLNTYKCLENLMKCISKKVRTKEYEKVSTSKELITWLENKM